MHRNCLDGVQTDYDLSDLICSTCGTVIIWMVCRCVMIMGDLWEAVLVVRQAELYSFEWGGSAPPECWRKRTGQKHTLS